MSPSAQRHVRVTTPSSGKADKTASSPAGFAVASWKLALMQAQAAAALANAATLTSGRQYLEELTIFAGFRARAASPNSRELTHLGPRGRATKTYR
jgi:hypothetical protein